MDAIKGNIYAILNGNKQFLIPVYQRLYSWEIEQCQRLWKDIVSMQKQHKVGHFVGSIVNIAEQAMPTGVQKYMLIDGQQRMTTLSLLLIALRDYGIKHPEDTTINPTRIDNMLLKNAYEMGDDQYKLLLTETDRDILIALIDRKPLMPNVESRILKNLKFFSDQIEKMEITPVEVYESIGKLQIVNITLDRTMDDAQAIFESLRDDYKEFPDDDKFRAAFIARDVYNMRARNFILSHLENYNNKAPITIENFTIEHIMPQNSNLKEEWKQALGVNWKDIQKKYLHSIGNLTLTAYNSEMSDNPFMDKMTMPGGFQESALRLNSYVVKQTTWNEKCIVARANLLADKAIEIWKYPVLTEDELKPYATHQKVAAGYSIESYDLSKDTRELFDVLDRRILNVGAGVKREFKKLYIAYKLDTNFVDIVVQKQRLRVSINMKFSEIYDPKGLCHDITGIGRWGNGDVEVFFEHLSDIDDIMKLIEQSFKKQLDDNE